MKNLLLSLTYCLFLITSAVAQDNIRNIQCNTAISTYVFQQKAREVRNAKQEKGRLNKAKRIVESYCLTSEQVKEIASYFVNDFDRLLFAKAAYPKTFDQENFYDVYDAFAYFSTVFRLHDYVQEVRNDQLANNGNGGNSNTPPAQGGNIVFPNYNYPDPGAYTGTTKCARPMTEAAFLYRLQDIKRKSTDQSKLLAAVNLANNECLSTSQVMKLSSMLSLEQNKLNLLKQSYDAVYDPINFKDASQIFSNSSSLNDFQNFLNVQIIIGGGGNGNGGNTGGNGGNFSCQIDAAEFSRISQNIRSQVFNNTRLNTAKQIVRSKGKCFTASQARDLTKLFEFESAKIEFAKFCYDYTLNQSDYYQVNEAFEFNSSTEELNEFINGRN